MKFAYFEPDRATRFEIVVINHGLIHLFLENFGKVKGFDPAQDRIVVLDCSAQGQRERVDGFARAHGWALGGPEIIFVKRANWGMNQGGQIDYLSMLLRARNRPRYVWQFQDHFLDTTSPYARYPDYMEDVAGQIKEDIIPDGMVLDLDQSERAFQDPEVSVVYADRLGLRVFLHPDGREWFFADGGNLGLRTEAALRGFEPGELDNYRLVFDASYRWAGFFEVEFGRCLSNGSWHDLELGRTWRSWDEVRRAEETEGKTYSLRADERFIRMADRYHRRLVRLRSLRPAVRAGMLKTTFPALRAFQANVFFPLRSRLRAKGIHSPLWMREIW